MLNLETRPRVNVAHQLVTRETFQIQVLLAHCCVTESCFGHEHYFLFRIKNLKLNASTFVPVVDS